MEAAHPFARAEEVETRRIERDGDLVALMRSIDMGGRYTVIVEVFPPRGERGPARMRPYAFVDSSAAGAFVNEAISSFTLLGCEVRTV